MSRARIGGFELRGALASRRTSTVYRAVHRSSGLLAAIKVLHPQVDEPELVAQAAWNEASALAALCHPNIVELYDVGVVRGREATPELIEGAPWFAIELAHATLGETRREWPELRRHLECLLGALQHAHTTGFLHRDIKPTNLLLDAQNQLKVADFGLTRGADAGISGLLGGTQGFIAPEQSKGQRRKQGPWTDLFAVGKLAHRITQGDGPTGLREWIASLTHPDPRERPRTAAEALGLLGLLDPNHAPLASLAAAPPGGLRSRPQMASTNLIGLRPPPLVGRGEETERLWRALRELVSAGTSSGVAITGPEGVGKTALGAWLHQQAAESGRVRAVRVEPSEGIAGLLTALLGVRHLTTGEVLRVALDGGWPTWVGDELWADGTTGTLPTPKVRGKRIAALADQLSAEPMLVWLDDLGAGSPLWHVAEALLASARPVLVLTAGERREGWQELPLTELEGSPLSGVLGPTSRDLDQALLSLSGGNPGAAMLALEAWSEEGELSVVGGRAQLMADHTSFPRAVRNFWRRRVSTLTPDQKQAAVMAALLGEVSPATYAQTGCVLAEARSSGLLAPGDRVRVRCSALGQVLAESATATAKRKAAHALPAGGRHAAARLSLLQDTSTPEELGRELLVMAEWELPRDPSRAHLALIRWQQEVADNQPSPEQLVHALHLTLRTTTRTRDRAGHIDATEELWRHGRLVQDPEALALSMVAQGVSAWLHRGDVGTAERWGERALERSDSRRARAASHALLARTCRLQHLHERAEDHALTGLRADPTRGDLARELARVRASAGDAIGAQETLTIQLQATADQPWEHARTLTALGDIDAAGGDLQGARHWWNQAQSVFPTVDAEIHLLSIDLTERNAAELEGLLATVRDHPTDLALVGAALLEWSAVRHHDADVAYYGTLLKTLSFAPHPSIAPTLIRVVSLIESWDPATAEVLTTIARRELGR